MSDTETLAPEVYRAVDQVSTQSQDGVDYAGRKRNFEWRRRWFYMDRSLDDEAFLSILQRGRTVKDRLIREFRGSTRHRAGYAPAGAGTPWFSIGPRNVNGRVKSIAVHPTNPDIVYAGAASGGMWKSIDGAQSWRPQWDMQDTMAIGSIAIAPSAPNTVYVGTGEWTPGWNPSFPGTGLFVTNDGGATWTQRAALVSRRVARVLISPTDANTVYVAGANGFESSSDGGVTWTTLRTGQISDAVIDPTDANTLYINARFDGIYRTTDAGATWSLLTNGPTGANADWVRLAIGQNGASGTDFLLAKRSGTIYRSTDGGDNWSTLSGSHGAASFHEWCNLIAVAPDDENIIMAGGVGLERTTNGGANWSNVAGLHADHHVAVFAPSDNNIVYTCNDGGVYRSDNKGSSWTKASHGLIVTQFYDIGAWVTIATVLGGGTQDQGTNMTTGGLTWRNILGADGGYFVVHPTNPRVMYGEFQNTNIRKTVDGGNTWVQKTAGLSGSTPWTGVIAMDPNAPDTLFAGTNRVFRTTDGCDTPWVASSQTLTGDVTSIAIAESNSNRVYAGTTAGRIYRSDDNGATSPWAEKSSGLPSRPLKDIVVDHTNHDRVLSCFGGTGTGHVFLSTDGGDGWTDVSGSLPDVPTNALALDPVQPDTFYAGTDVGVFRTTDAGVTWHAFDNGLPSVIVIDLQVDRVANMLFAATFGRGMYKVSISGASAPEVDLYLRDSILDTGERFPSPSNQPNPNDLTDQVHWWESPDIKADVTPYYTPDAVFDGVEFDELLHEDPKRTETNRFYLQVHNRGWQDATNVRVRAFLADASAGLPPLPNALVAPDFNLSSTANWTPIGPARNIPVLEPNRPVVVSWDYNVPSGTATHSCVLAVISSAQDPITTPETNVDLLIKNEKRVCLKNLHVVNSSGPRPQQTMATIRFHNARRHDDLVDIIIVPDEFSEGTIGLLLPPIRFADERTALDGVQLYRLRENEDIGEFYVRPGSKAQVDWMPVLREVDRSLIYEFDASKQSALRGVTLAAGQSLHGVLTFKGSRKVPYGQTQQFTVMQMQGGDVVGGSTYELRLTRARGLYPVSRIRIVLEKVRILDDHDPWIKGAGEFHFTTAVTFNGDPCRTHQMRVPQKGHYKISDRAGRDERELNVCVFEGYVAERDQLSVSILPTEEDWLDADDSLCRYVRHFSGPPETWVGRYAPDDEAPEHDAERRSDWLLWYRIESLPLLPDRQL